MNTPTPTLPPPTSTPHPTPPLTPWQLPGDTHPTPPLTPWQAPRVSKFRLSTPPPPPPLLHPFPNSLIPPTPPPHPTNPVAAPGVSVYALAPTSTPHIHTHSHTPLPHPPLTPWQAPGSINIVFGPRCHVAVTLLLYSEI
ncbi:uncharacterized protein [Penaeus vannamei]|uniref:uncharacterized protein n=1 Tax=Penaeus vannamei TaxID=6689 RepID=UPI00387F44AB